MIDPHEYELTDEEHEALVLISEHAIAPPLSPAARAVLNAYRDADIDDEVTAAAVLRAAALYCKRDRLQLLSIADELDRIHTDPESDIRTDILDDGSVRVCFGDFCGIVSSFHLVEPKLNQLRQAWFNAQELRTDNLK